MKGEIFNLLEVFIVENWGQETFEEIFEEVHAKLATKEPFVGPGTYPDSDLFAIAGSAAAKLNISLPEALRAFGKFCFPKLALKVPQFVSPFHHPKDFLLTLHNVIHVEVKKLYKDAEPPNFFYRDPAPSQLVMIYDSRRKLYDFVEGLLDGVSDYFKVPIQVRRTPVMQDGKEMCEFLLTFGSST